MPQVVDTAAKIAEFLLEINAIRLRPEDPFTWASGWKSPIYSDNRLVLSYPHIRSFIKTELCRLTASVFPGTQAIIGVATAGIAPGALVADAMELPFGYVRSEAKKHGMAKQVEGELQAGQRVVVVEDLVSTGKSSLAAVDAVRASGALVDGLVCIFTYGFEAAEKNFASASCPFFALSNYNTLIDVAASKGIITPSQVSLLGEWRKSPETWGK